MQVSTKMRHLIKKFPDHIANSLTFPGLQNSLTIPGFPGLWEPCLIETTKLSCTVFEMLSLIFQKLKRSCDSDHAPLRDNVVLRLRLAMINMHTKFEVFSLSHSRDILGKLKI